MLTPENLNELRSALQAKLEALQEEIAEQDATLAARGDCSVTDPADAAELQERRHRAAALKANREATLVEVQAALLRIDAGRYGISETDGEPIALERLRAVPWART